MTTTVARSHFFWTYREETFLRVHSQNSRGADESIEERGSPVRGGAAHRLKTPDCGTDSTRTTHLYIHLEAKLTPAMLSAWHSLVGSQ